MATCTSCGTDVTGKKFCPECGTPVQTQATHEPSTSTSVCPRCGDEVKPGAAFCNHCGSALGAQATAPSQPLTRICPSCHTDVPASNAFCTNCGQSFQVATPQAAPNVSFCTNCGHQNNPGVNFCAVCGKPLNATPQSPYAQPGPFPQYQPQYGQQYPQQYNQYPQQQYGQPAYQANPMLGQQPMVLRCPVCMAMSPVGSSNCPSCRTSLANIVPTPANMPAQGQQGGFGGLFQGSGGNMAMGALGGAAAVIGGEMLLHEIEGGRRHGYDYNYEDRRDDGPLGGLGEIANDIGLF